MVAQRTFAAPLFALRRIAIISPFPASGPCRNIELAHGAARMSGCVPLRPESGPPAPTSSGRSDAPIRTPLRPHVQARHELAVLTGSRRAGAPPAVPGARDTAAGGMPAPSGSSTPARSFGRKTPGLSSDNGTDRPGSGRVGAGDGGLPPPGPPVHARSHAFSKFCLGRFYRDTTITGATLEKKREAQRERLARDREQRQRERFEQEAAAVGDLEEKMAMRAERQRRRRQRLRHRAAARGECGERARKEMRGRGRVFVWCVCENVLAYLCVCVCVCVCVCG